MIREVFLFFEVISISKLLTDVTDSDTITLIFRYRTKRRHNGQDVRGLPSSTNSFVEWADFSLALYDEDGDIFVYSTDQSAHQTLHECSLLLSANQ